MYVAKGASESNKLAESVGFIHPELGEEEEEEEFITSTIKHSQLIKYTMYRRRN